MFVIFVLMRFFELGADIVMYLVIKYLGGYSDFLGGVLVVDNLEFYD